MHVTKSAAHFCNLFVSATTFKQGRNYVDAIFVAMDPPSSSSTCTSRYVPIFGSAKKVWQVLQPGGTCEYYWWAVEWDLANLTQNAQRRQDRWECLLAKAGWDVIGPGNFQPSYLTLHRRPGDFAEHDPVNLFEQSVRTDILFFLLGFSSRNGKRPIGQNQLIALARGDFLADSDSKSLQGEVCLGHPSCLASCPFLNGQLDIGVIQALSDRGDRAMRRVLSKLQQADRRNSCPFEQALWASLDLGFSQILCDSIATLVAEALTDSWPQLSTDPIFSRSMPRPGKKSSARFDPDLKNAVADAVRGGPSGMQILDRTVGAYKGTSLLRCKHFPRASRLDEEDLCLYLGTLKTLASQSGPSSVAIAVDGSRVGGKKLLCGPVMFANSLQCAWPLPQIMRDFRANLCGSLSSADIEDCLLGFECFPKPLLSGSIGEDLGDLTEGGECSQKVPKSRGNAPRIASLDLGYALESWLQSAGLSLSNFQHFS